MPITNSDTLALMGVPISNVTMDEVVAFVDRAIVSGGFHQIATANVDFVTNAIKDPELQKILCDCDMVVPDGMPLLWIARMMNRPLRERVCGVDMVPRLAELAAQRGHRMFLLGASDATSAKAAATLQEKYPGLNICGRYSPPVRCLDEMDHEDILRRIAYARPDILLVAFGNPKQEKWLDMHRERLSAVCVGVGGSLDFIAGNTERAPRWMQSLGLEWLCRFVQEPRRLARRYLTDAAALTLHVPQQVVPHALQARRRSGSQVFADWTDHAIVISVKGRLCDKSLDEFSSHSGKALKTGMNVVFNLSAMTYLGIDALGELVKLRSQLKPTQQMWLAGVRLPCARVLEGARLRSHFTLVPSMEDAMYRARRAEQRKQSLPFSTYSHPATQTDDVQMRLVSLFNVCQKVAAADHAVQHRFDRVTEVLPAALVQPRPRMEALRVG